MSEPQIPGGIPPEHEIEQKPDEPGFWRRLFSKIAFWLLLAYMIIGIVVVDLVVVHGQQQEEQQRREAALQAQIQQQHIRDAGDVRQCFERARSGPQTAKVLDLLVILADNAIKANVALLKTETDPVQIKIRNDALKRLRPAKRTAKDFIEAVAKATPSEEACVAMAHRKNVNWKPIRASVFRPK